MKMCKDNKINKDAGGKNWYQITAILIGSLSSLSTGLLISWPSPFMPKIVEDKEHYDITEKQASLFTAINVIGLIILSPICVPLINVIGRKNGLLISSIPYCISLLIKAFITNIWGLYLARLILGLGDVFVFTCLPVYIGELSTPEVRGLWGNAFVCSIFTGQFLINVLGAYFTVQETSFIAITIPILFLITFPFMPETPYFYLSKGQDEKAMNSLRTLRRKSNVEKEFIDIKTAVERQLAEPSSWLNLIKIPINRKAFLVASFLRCSQLFGGIMSFSVYTKYIFQNSSAMVDPNLSSIIYSAVNAACHTVASLASNRFGRRKSFMYSVILCAVVLFALGIFFVIKDYYPEIPLEKLNWFPLTGMLSYLLFCSCGLGTVPTLMLGELFSSSVKGKGVALVSSMFGLTGFAVNNLFYYLASSTGLCGPFFFFALCNLLASIIAYFIVPETKGKTLEEIQQALKK